MRTLDTDLTNLTEKLQKFEKLIEKLIEIRVDSFRESLNENCNELMICFKKTNIDYRKQNSSLTTIKEQLLEINLVKSCNIKEHSELNNDLSNLTREIEDILAKFNNLKDCVESGLFQLKVDATKVIEELKGLRGKCTKLDQFFAILNFEEEYNSIKERFHQIQKQEIETQKQIQQLEIEISQRNRNFPTDGIFFF
jgi:hypothetical protein